MTRNNIAPPVSLRTILRGATLVFIIGLVALYGYRNTRDIAQGPIVEIHRPADGHLATDRHITVTGIARHIAFLTLNGRAIFTTEDGSFEESLLLPKGSSILEVTGRDKFDRTTSVQRRVIFNP